MSDGSSNALLGFTMGSIAVVIAMLAVFLLSGREDPRRVTLDLTVPKIGQTRIN